MITTSPATVVQAQLDAYNAKDIEALLRTYAQTAMYFEVHGPQLAHGAGQLRVRFEARFAEPDLHARLISRNVVGNIVVDVEVITRNFPYASTPAEVVNRGQTIQVNTMAGNTIMVDGIAFELKQFHFHALAKTGSRGKNICSKRIWSTPTKTAIWRWSR